MRLQISGPSTIAPGSHAQFSAIGTYSGAQSKDLTATVTWHSSDTSILTIDASGLASAIQNGAVNISAAAPGLAAMQSVVVTPDGTYRLSGFVAGVAGFGVAGALVQVTSGIGAGLSTSTDGVGSFALFGVAGQIQLTVTQSDYVTKTQAVTVTTNSSITVNLIPVNPPPDLTGTYTLRITAAPTCSNGGAGALPSIALARQYTATITEQPTQVTVLLSGANFFVTFRTNNGFTGSPTATGAVFDVNDPSYYYSGRLYEFGEVLSDGNLYGVSGLITVTSSSGNLVGSLNGAINVLSPAQAVVAQCTSASHSVVFTRQPGTTGRRIRR